MPINKSHINVVVVKNVDSGKCTRTGFWSTNIVESTTEQGKDLFGVSLSNVLDYY